MSEKKYYCIQCDKSYPDDQACRHRYNNVIDPKDILVKVHCEDCFYGKPLDAPELHIVLIECHRYPALTVDKFGWGVYPRNAETHWCGEGRKK